jgi:hypothetical protein
MGYRSGNCCEPIGQDECHGQIVRNECVAVNEITKPKHPIWQFQKQKPFRVENWHTEEKIGGQCEYQIL